MKAMQCSLCSRWIHGTCSGFSKKLQKLEAPLEFECPSCYDDPCTPYPFRILLKDYETVRSVATAPAKNRSHFGHRELVRMVRNEAIAKQLTIDARDLREWCMKSHVNTFDLDRQILHQIQGRNVFPASTNSSSNPCKRDLESPEHQTIAYSSTNKVHAFEFKPTKESVESTREVHVYMSILYSCPYYSQL